jgi:hypothetical protein
VTTKPRARPGPAPGPAVQLATALAPLCQARQPREVTELPGGLTNHNYRVRSLDLDVVGRSAVEAARAVTPPRRVVSFVVRDPTAYPWGGELVLRDGRPVGQVTSAAWGATVGAGVGLALVGDREAGEATGEWVRTGSG